MQITDSMMTNQFLYNLNQVESRMMHYQNEMTSGKSLNRPSDNPLAVAEDMQDNEQLTQLQAYSQTIQSGLAWMNTTNTALTSMTSVLQSIRSTVLNASNTPDTNPQTVDGFRQTLLSDVNNLYQLADTQVGNNYIFGGYDTETAPSSALQTTNMTTTLTATSSSAALVLPQGANVTVATSANQINIPIQAGSTLAQIVSQINNQAGGLGVTAALNSTGTQLVFSYAPTTSTTNSALSITSNFFSVHQGTSDTDTSATGAINYQVSNATSETVNVTANALFRSPNTNGVSLRSTLQNILNDVNNPSRLETDLGNLDQNISQILSTSAALGANIDQMNTLNTENSTYQTTVENQQATLQDANMAKVSVNYQSALTSYQAALSTGAKLLPENLSSYL